MTKDEATQTVRDLASFPWLKMVEPRSTSTIDGHWYVNAFDTNQDREIQFVRYSDVTDYANNPRVREWKEEEKQS